MDAAISSYCTFPYGSAKSVLKSTNTSSASPPGCWLMVAMTSSIFEVLYRAKYHPTINHCMSPDASWKLTTFAP